MSAPSLDPSAGRATSIWATGTAPGGSVGPGAGVSSVTGASVTGASMTAASTGAGAAGAAVVVVVGAGSVETAATVVVT